MLAAIEAGYVQREIQEAAYRFQQSLERGDEVTVGLNRFQEEEEIPIPLQQLDPSIEQDQRNRLRQLRSRRERKNVIQLRERLFEAASGQDNLMPIIIDCVENDLTLGEICQTLREVWGEYQASTII